MRQSHLSPIAAAPCCWPPQRRTPRPRADKLCPNKATARLACLLRPPAYAKPLCTRRHMPSHLDQPCPNRSVSHAYKRGLTSCSSPPSPIEIPFYGELTVALFFFLSMLPPTVMLTTRLFPRSCPGGAPRQGTAHQTTHTSSHPPEYHRTIAELPPSFLMLRHPPKSLQHLQVHSEPPSTSAPPPFHQNVVPPCHRLLSVRGDLDRLVGHVCGSVVKVAMKTVHCLEPHQLTTGCAMCMPRAHPHVGVCSRIVLAASCGRAPGPA
jgi:hypothetical protein